MTKIESGLCCTLLVSSVLRNKEEMKMKSQCMRKTFPFRCKIPCSHRYFYQKQRKKFGTVSVFASLPFFSSGRVDSITLPRFHKTSTVRRIIFLLLR